MSEFPKVPSLTHCKYKGKRVGPILAGLIELSQVHNLSFMDYARYYM
jgi:hypothetical protein